MSTPKFLGALVIGIAICTAVGWIQISIDSIFKCLKLFTGRLITNSNGITEYYPMKYWII